MKINLFFVSRSLLGEYHGRLLGGQFHRHRHFLTAGERSPNGSLRFLRDSRSDLTPRCYQVKHTLDAASFAHCQNFSAAELRRPFRATMPTENGFGSGVRCKNFTRFPKL